MLAYLLGPARESYDGGDTSIVNHPPGGDRTRDRESDYLSRKRAHVMLLVISDDSQSGAGKRVSSSSIFSTCNCHFRHMICVLKRARACENEKYR